jgi:predicted ABC-type ATPase
VKPSRELDRRPVIVAIAGPNGAGKTTFYHSFVAPTALRYVSADIFAHQLQLDAYAAASAADILRRELVRQRESFAFETVFSDPVGSKLKFLADAIAAGYLVVLCFIGLENARLSEERVAMRVSQGGHDVPTEKLKARFPRTLANLTKAIQRVPFVYIYDNSDLRIPFRRVAVFHDGEPIEKANPLPGWLKEIV